MRTGISFTVSSHDCQRLQAIVAGSKSLQKHVWRARIVLLSVDGLGTSAIMAGTGKSKTCVWRWQERFMHEGVNGLLRDRSRPPGKAPIAPDHVAGIVRLALKPPPLEATHWTLRAMVKTAGVAASTVPGGLEGARPQPTPLATLQALERPGFCREAHGYRRPLC
jgi:transposase